MSLEVDVAADRTRLPLGRARIASLVRRVLAAEGVRHAQLSFAFVSARAIAQMNKRHLGHSGATDVISFPLLATAEGEPLGGDVYIAPDVARTNARELGVPLREELARLVIHATLHVLGHDHPDGVDRTRSAMWRRQEALLDRFASEWRR